MLNSTQRTILMPVLVLAAILFAFYGVAELNSWLSDEMRKKNDAEHLRHKKVTQCDQPYSSTADYYNREFLGTCGYTPEMYRVVEKFEFISNP